MSRHKTASTRDAAQGAPGRPVAASAAPAAVAAPQGRARSSAAPRAAATRGRSPVRSGDGADEQSPAERLQRIRELAYRNYLERGGGDGHDLEDWLKAEAQLG